MAASLQERPRQRFGSGGGRHSPHRDRPEGTSQRGIRREDLRSRLEHLGTLELQHANHVPQEVGAPPPGLDQRDRPAGAGELHHQTGGPGPAADVQERGGRDGQDGQEEQRIQHEVKHTVSLGPISRQAADLAPSSELFQVHSRAPLERGVDRNPEARDPRLEESPRIDQRGASAPGFARAARRNCL
jgi:hypothetical protein